MSEYKNILNSRVEQLKTSYLTLTTNIERIEKDLKEAKVTATETLGAIKHLELLKEQFNNIKEEKVIENKRIPLTEEQVERVGEVISKVFPTVVKIKTPRIIKKKK